MNLLNHVQKFAALGEIPNGTIRARFNQPQTMEARALLRQVLAGFADAEGNLPKFDVETFLLALLANAAPSTQIDTSNIRGLDEAVDALFVQKKADGDEDEGHKPSRVARGKSKRRSRS